MPAIELNAELTSVVEARLDVGKRIQDQKDRFEKYANRRLERLHRELASNNQKCLLAVAKSLGLAIPAGAFMGMSRPGVAVVSWDGPDPREQAKKAADEKARLESEAKAAADKAALEKKALVEDLSTLAPSDQAAVKEALAPITPMPLATAATNGQDH